MPVRSIDMSGSADEEGVHRQGSSPNGRGRANQSEDIELDFCPFRTQSKQESPAASRTT